MIFRKCIAVLVVCFFMTARADSEQSIETLTCHFEKVAFDINDVGRYESLVYEFCIPYQDQYLKEVQNISPSINCSYGSHGRIGCRSDEYLCSGSSSDDNFKEVLCQLSRKDYVKRIQECFFE